MRNERSLVAPLATAVLGIALAACGGGGGGGAGGGGGGNPGTSTGPLSGSWIASTTFTADFPLEGGCSADVVGTLSMELAFCEPCETDPDSCGALCDAYFITSPSIAVGGLAAVVEEHPAAPELELILVGAYYDASRDRTVGLSFGIPGNYGFLTDTGWEASADCVLYEGDVLIPDPDEPGDLTIDPEASPLCSGTLRMVGVRAASATLAGPEGGSGAELVGRFLPRGAAPMTMRLGREADRVRVALELPEEALVLEAPLAESGRFGLVLEDGTGRVAIDGLLDGAEAAVGTLALERDGGRREGRFLLLAE